KRDMQCVAAAGPASDVIMGVFWALVLSFASAAPATLVTPLAYMAQAGIMINVVLMVLNLIPLPPLDGGRIAVSLLPNDLANRYARVEQYGFIILLVLLFTGVLSKIMSPFIYATLSMISWIFS